jgi:hypothetical protein
MSFVEVRSSREAKTIQSMVGIYCGRHHFSNGELCKDCRRLLEYVVERTRACPYGDKKPVCGKCPTHCYEAEKRQAVLRVMQNTGSRMMLRHPVLTIWHWLHAMQS